MRWFLTLSESISHDSKSDPLPEMIYLEGDILIFNWKDRGKPRTSQDKKAEVPDRDSEPGIQALRISVSVPKPEL